jgi:plasmid stabilization system protein ParE
MRRWYHREARQELRDAVLWYEDQRPGLGAELFAAVRATLSHIEENPRRFPAIYRDLRQAVVPRFPYLVFFIPRKDRLEIYAVFHTSRAPEVWKQRLNEP